MSVDIDLSVQIEDLISSNAEDFEIAKVIKKAIKSYLGSLNEHFDENAGKDFLVKHTKQIDDFLKIIYKYILRKNFKNYYPSINSIPIAMVALGSYGREQLCVYSDIDLMLVYKNISGFNINSIVENIIQIAWDCGLKLGHRVHEVDELFEVSNSDITIKSSLIESRFIYGSKILYGEVDFRLRQIRKFEQKEFIVAKMQEYQERIDENAICMEPNIKDGIGGLRDANTLFWIANVKYSISRIKDLTDYYDIFTPDEYKSFRISLEFLFKVRSALHLCAKKKQDVLILQYIPDIAKKLDIKESRTISSELKLIKMVFEAQKNIHKFCAIFLTKITDRFFTGKYTYSFLKDNRIQKKIFIIDNTVYVASNAKYSNIDEVLEILISLPDIDLKFSDQFLYILDRANKSNIDRDLIFKLFQRDKYLSIIKLFFKANVIQKILPPFSRTINLAQFDGYHKSPVAQHSIDTLMFVENIKNDYIKSIYSQLSEKNKILIKAVALFHDVGKGRKEDHSLAGEKIFRVFFNKLGFEKIDIANGALLIKYHTSMTACIQKEDIYNQKVILSFASKFHTKELLDMIFVLTYADVSSVKEELFSSQTEYLLKELYKSSLLSLDKSELLTNTARRDKKINSIKKDDRFKSYKKLTQKKVTSINSDLLFIKYKKNMILDIVDSAIDMSGDFVYKVTNNSFLSISIIKSIDINLGFLLGKLSFLNIVNMDIFLLFDNKKYFKIDFLESVTEEEIDFVKNVIEMSFDMTKKIRLKKPIINRKCIVIDENHSKDIAKIVINAKDQKGFLAYISSLLDEFGIEIETAKIHTSKNRVKDLILVKKSDNFTENIDKVLDELCEN
jgi:[protein-PII] uridylyltransferase